MIVVVVRDPSTVINMPVIC